MKRLGIHTAIALIATTTLFAILPAVAHTAPLYCVTGSGDGQCSNPKNVAVDVAANRLYVADSANNRIGVFNAETGAFVRTFGFGVRTGADTFQICEAACRAGIADGDAKPGQFENVTGIAVDNNPTSPSFHDVYVAEMGSFNQRPRVQKLDPLTGSEEKGVEFLLMLGKGVNKSVSGDICTAVSGHICGAAANSEAEGGFFVVGSSGVFVDVGPDGSLYAVDRLRPGGEAGISLNRLQRFEESGAQISPQQILFEASNGPIAGIAIESSGDLWAIGALSLRKFDVTGTQIQSIPTGGNSPLGVAVDAADNVFIGISEGKRARIIEFGDSGSGATPQRSFGYGSLDLAFAGLDLPPSPTNPWIIASDAFTPGTGSVLGIDFPNPGPLVFPEPCKVSGLGNTKAALLAAINPEGEATKYHFELATNPAFTGATRLPAQASEDPTVSSKPGQAFPLFELEEAKLEATGLQPETKYHCRVVAENSAGTAVGEPGEFETREHFEVREVWAALVGTSFATLSVEVNPLGLSTKGFFEYVTDAQFQASGYASAQRVPVEEELDFGSGESFVTRATQVSGLAPGTLYHYRPVGTNAFSPAGITEPEWERTFRTYPVPGPFALPDGRGWELVSPDQKNSAEAGTPGRAGGLYAGEEFSRIVSAAPSGDAITYTSWTSFGQPQGAPATSQYLAKRSATGWGTENISPPGFLRNPLRPPYRGFTPDLGFGAFVVDEPALAAGAQGDTENIYLRDNGTGGLRALTTEAPDFKKSGDIPTFCSAFGGASNDGSRAFFAAAGAMAGAPSGAGFSLYEHSSAGLQLTSILPDGTPAKPDEESGYGAGGSYCKMDQSIIANAVSSDGSVAFWTYGGKYKTSEQPLLARVNGVETVQLDAKATGGSGSGEGQFWAATADGSRAFFTTPQKLLGSAVAGSKSLYRYELGKPEGERLTNLTPGAIAPDVKGVVGISAEGSHAYFVAGGVLSGEEENAAGQKAETGANNLYVYQEGEVPAVRFIARLSDLGDALDVGAWSPSPERRNARVAANGDLAFLSIETQALSGYNNAILGGGGCQLGNADNLFGDPHCAAAYLYDASERELTCVSCNPANARPIGPTELPVWTNPLEGPRFLSEDGSRLFFESRDVLSPDDLNGGRRDVYEYERLGAGSCSAGHPAFNPASGGCVSLISSGRSEDNSFLIDASADGRDVFFGTRQSLVGWDTNPNYDVYDAREGGGFPEPVPGPDPCLGEACKPPATAPPSSGSSPSTPNFHGPGNQKPKKAKKKHKKKSKAHKKKGKSAKKKGKGTKKKRAGQERRAPR